MLRDCSASISSSVRGRSLPGTGAAGGCTGNGETSVSRQRRTPTAVTEMAVATQAHRLGSLCALLRLFLRLLRSWPHSDSLPLAGCAQFWPQFVAKCRSSGRVPACGPSQSQATLHSEKLACLLRVQSVYVSIGCRWGQLQVVIEAGQTGGGGAKTCPPGRRRQLDLQCCREPRESSLALR